EHADRPQILFPVTEPFDAVGAEPLQVLERFEYALAGEPIQAPEQHQVELLSRGRVEHAAEGRAIRRLAGHLIHEFIGQDPSVTGLAGYEVTQLPQLVLVILTLVFRTYPCVQGDSHRQQCTTVTCFWTVLCSHHNSRVCASNQ